MKHVTKVVGACLSAALLAACGGDNGSSSTPVSVAPPLPSLAAPGAGLPQSVRSQPAFGGSHRVRKNALLYSFKGGTDGEYPYAGLTAVAGTLYGTTLLGGDGTCSVSLPDVCGTVFKITTSGAETVLHSFKGRRDGAEPWAGLTNVRGTLYGTTSQGGGARCAGYNGVGGCGTVFRITTSGAKTVLHSFKGRRDGALPTSGLINVNGVLYGTTQKGGGKGCGGSGCGTVFEVDDASCAESILYRFKGGADGEHPGGYLGATGLTNVNGTLYGTTVYGGAYGNGTVFKITTSGTESVLYSFKGAPDGALPNAALLDVNSTLYGTSTQGGDVGTGGKECNLALGCGTVFKITTSGTYRQLYRFRGAPDGAEPNGLTNMGGILYGTTLGGGSSANCPSQGGCGTIFAFLRKSGQELLLYSFARADGATPVSGLTNVNGTLYGTTASGGSNDAGAVFSFSP